MGTSESGTFGRAVSFSGRSWAVKRSNEPVGPGPNLFSDGAENVWVDADARLHHVLGIGRVRWVEPPGELDIDLRVVVRRVVAPDEQPEHHVPIEGGEVGGDREPVRTVPEAPVEYDLGAAPPPTSLRDPQV